MTSELTTRQGDTKQGDSTDEQLVRYIAAYGSLSQALEAGDIRLVVPDDTEAKPAEERQKAGRRRTHAKLATYL